MSTKMNIVLARNGGGYKLWLYELYFKASFLDSRESYNQPLPSLPPLHPHSMTRVLDRGVPSHFHHGPVCHVFSTLEGLTDLVRPSGMTVSLPFAS